MLSCVANGVTAHFCRAANRKISHRAVRLLTHGPNGREPSHGRSPRSGLLLAPRRQKEFWQGVRVKYCKNPKSYRRERRRPNSLEISRLNLRGEYPVIFLNSFVKCD